MEQLDRVVATAFSKIAESGAIEAAIEKQLTDTISSIIKEQMRSYSDFGKALEEQVKASLQVDFSTLKLPGYNDFILKIVRAQVDANVNNQVAAQVEAQMKDLLVSAPAEITLTKLVEDFIECKPDGCSCDGSDQTTLHLDEQRHGSRWVRLDKNAHKSEYECEISFLVTVETGKIGALRVGKREVDKTLFIGSIYGFERDLFQMYAAGTKLIIDAEPDDISLYYPGHDY
jgi:hypothetical protein